VSEFERAMEAALSAFRSHYDASDYPDIAAEGYVQFAIDAFLAELRKTHAIVPREATEEMIEAALATYHSKADTHYADEADVRAFYAAMLQASETGSAKP
jgi:hypothetical protein